MQTDNELTDIIDNKIPASHKQLKDAIIDFNANPKDKSRGDKVIREIKEHVELLNKTVDIIGALQNKLQY